MELVITTEEKLAEIVNRCLSNYNPAPAPVLAAETRYLHSLAELAQFLDCSIVSAQKLKNSGRIRFKQYGRKCIFSTAELMEDLENNKKRK